MPAGFELGPAGLSETAYADASWQPPASLHGVAVLHIEAAPLAVSSLQIVSGRFEEPGWGLNPIGVSAALPPGPVLVVTVIRIHFPNSELHTSHLQSLGSQAEPMPGAIPAPIAATSPIVSPQEESPPRPPQMAQAPVVAAASPGPLLGLLASPNVTTVDASVPAATPVRARDVVFQEYSTDLLLLSVGDNGSREFGPGRLDDDLWATADHERNDFAELGDSGLYDEITASLDALQRERDAIDAVLSELHDIELRHEKPRSDAAPGDQPATASAQTSAAETLPPSDAQGDLPASSDDAEGGMVLLEPSGDANLSSYDLAAIVAGDLEDIGETPLGIEASVGVYQAIDVGGSELRPSENAATPAALPNGAARPGASADSASGKSSERAS